MPMPLSGPRFAGIELKIVRPSGSDEVRYRYVVRDRKSPVIESDEVKLGLLEVETGLQSDRFVSLGKHDLAGEITEAFEGHSEDFHTSRSVGMPPGIREKLAHLIEALFHNDKLTDEQRQGFVEAAEAIDFGWQINTDYPAPHDQVDSKSWLLFPVID